MKFNAIPPEKLNPLKFFLATFLPTALEKEDQSPELSRLKVLSAIDCQCILSIDII